jgi:hypothetical protein
LLSGRSPSCPHTSAQGTSIDQGDLPPSAAPAVLHTFTLGEATKVTTPSAGGIKTGFQVTFTGTCAVIGADTEEDLRVRALINGAPMSPGEVTMCEDSSSTSVPETAGAAQWVIQNRPPGTYTIEIQWMTQSGATGFMAHWTMKVDRYKDITLELSRRRRGRGIPPTRPT